MKLFSYRRFWAISLACLLLLSSGVAQTPGATPPSSGTHGKTKRAYPRVAIGNDRELEYVGSFSPDGRFKPLTRFSRYVETMKTSSVSDDTAVAKTDMSSAKNARPSGGSRRLPVIRDSKPGGHLVEGAAPKALVTEMRDAVIDFMYGPEKIFKSPKAVTTDSKQRVIITDPDAHTVHVLDPANKASFSIVGGEGRRLQSPNGVAVDAEDNIYVSDSDLGVIVVYDAQGKFVHYIGSFNGENMYEAPGGMAIDRAAGRLYLLDPPRNLLFILDLEGKVLAHFGRPSSAIGQFAKRKGTGAGKGELDVPAEVVLHNDELIVLDAKARLQIFDLQGNFRKQIDLVPGEASGLCVDTQGNLYVSRETTDTVEAYDHEGKLLNSFGRTGSRLGEFVSPAGLWADATDRMYIVDSDNFRLQIFHLHATKQSAHAD